MPSYIVNRNAQANGDNEVHPSASGAGMPVCTIGVVPSTSVRNSARDRLTGADGPRPVAALSANIRKQVSMRSVVSRRSWGRAPW